MKVLDPDNISNIVSGNVEDVLTDEDRSKFDVGFEVTSISVTFFFNVDTKPAFIEIHDGAA